MNTFLIVILGVLIRRVNGFCLKQHTSILAGASPSSLKSSAVVDELYSKTNSSHNEDNRESDFEDDSDITATSYPWSEVQEWALRDNLSKYVVRIPIEKNKKSKEKTVALSTYALWRSLQQDVPELAGYPIDFLKSRHEEDSQKLQKSDNGAAISSCTPIGVLPFLQDYEFSADGGISGYVYGLYGLSDGSRIQTSAIINVKESLPKGYIQTSDGATYELGRPLETNEKGDPIRTKLTAVPESMLAKVSDAASDANLRSVQGAVEDADGLLLRLGATTGILLAGATAVNMLSHHLTVNVFWV